MSDGHSNNRDGAHVHRRCPCVYRSTDPSHRAPFTDQVVTCISKVYDCNMPPKVQRVLEMFDLVNINVAALGLPLQCIGLGGFEEHLAFTMFAPVVIAATTLLGFLASPLVAGICARDSGWYRRGRAKKRLLAALPWLLLLSFLVFPMVTSTAFLAFSCEEFDNGRSFLRADYAIECSDTEAWGTYKRVELLAWFGILLYPVGRPVG